jgi:glycosyltransferase involved in cell wall biosynthesis
VSSVNDVLWFAPNRYGTLLLPELRRRGLSISLDDTEPARLAFAMSGTVAERAWRYASSRGCPLIQYIWDLPPDATGTGSYDPVWWVGGRFLRLPRPFGGFSRRRGYYSRLRHIAARALEVWVPSAMSETAVQQRFEVSTRRVPYCYDSDRFRPVWTTRDDPPTLLTVSRLNAYKNQAATLRAAAVLGRDVQVRLIGRGPRYGALDALARSLGVVCRIDTDADDVQVAEAYRRARVAVCPSRFEGFGVTPLEAVASGTPVVASDISPHREFVGNAACFFPLDDDRSLVQAVVAALDGPTPDPELVGQLTIPVAAERFASLLGRLLR